LVLKTQLDIAGAAVNIKLKKYPNAIKLLEAAIPKVKHKIQKVRYNFVLAQLYALNKNNVQAGVRYKKVIKLNPPYQFAFNAKLNMAKAINIKNRGEVKNAKLVLREMLRDDKNLEYFDQIYFELGNLELADKSEAAAAVEYTNCLRSNGTDMGIKSNAYLALADIYFKKQDYENAQVFYDSAARTIDPTHPDYKKIQDKNLVLNELIKHLVNIKEKDSLLRLADNEKLREKIIDKLIKQEKEKAEQEKFNQENKKNQLNSIDNSNGLVTSTNFPFYNMSSRTKGLQDFQRIWGARELMDFWAVSSNKSELWKKIDNEQKSNDLGSELKKAAMEKAPNERKKYYENLPFTKLEKQQMKDDLAESYFLGANVYYQDLKEYDKAKKMLEELNAKYPDNKFQINA
jgi:tetratricopeptide (TPR) repeat protein